jgi:type II secretory pathway pseudopilin PulG
MSSPVLLRLRPPLSRRAGRGGIPSGRAGFSLVELLLVVGVLLVLGMIVLTTTGPVRKMGQVTRCSAHLRQIGVAYRMYRDDYGYYPDPLAVTRAPYIGDRRILYCPEDSTIAELQTASSYRFRLTVPPDYALVTRLSDLDASVVLASCEHHLGQRTKVSKGDQAHLTPPAYPYHLVLRAGGQVERILLSRVRQFFQSAERPVLRTLYPDEPGYKTARSTTRS